MQTCVPLTPVTENSSRSCTTRSRNKSFPSASRTAISNYNFDNHELEKENTLVNSIQENKHRTKKI